MAILLKKSGHLSSCFIVLHFFIIFSLFVLAMPGRAAAQSAGECGFNSIGDWTCPQNQGGSSGFSGPLSGGGSNPFAPGGSLFPTLPPGSLISSSELSACMAPLSLIVSAISPGLQSCLSSLVQNLDYETTSCSDLALLAGVMMTAQGAIETLEVTINCPPPNNNTMPLSYLQQGLINEICSTPPSELLKAGGVTGVISDFVTDVAIPACTNSNTPYTAPTPPDVYVAPTQTTPTTSSQTTGSQTSTTGACAPVNNATIDAEIAAHLRLREGNDGAPGSGPGGSDPGPGCAYRDSRGKLTIGIGHLIKAGDPYTETSCISDAEQEELLKKDAASAKAAAQAQMSQMGVNSQAFLVALTSVNFQLGTAWNKPDPGAGFVNTWQNLLNHNWQGARDGVTSSAWNSQTPVRTEDFRQAITALEACMSGTRPSANTASVGTSAVPASAASSGQGAETPPSCMTSGASGWTQERSNQAIQISNSDDAGSGYCAKGVANILEQMGYPVTRGNATDWKSTLPANGWTRMNGVTPDTAPVGTVCFFDNDASVGKPNRGTGGGSFGHVEIVATHPDGRRTYISDSARNNWGGTVPDNFGGCYYYGSAAAGGTTTNPACSAQAGGGQQANYTPEGAQAGSGGFGFGFLSNLLSFPGISSVAGVTGLSGLPGLPTTSLLFSGANALLGNGVLNLDTLLSGGFTVDSLTGALTQFTNAQIDSVMSQLTSAASGITNGILETFTGVTPEQLTNITNILNSTNITDLMNTVTTIGIDNLIEQVSNLTSIEAFAPEGIMDAFENIRDTLQSGNGILSGIENTINSAITDGIENITSGILDELSLGVRNTLNNTINSTISTALGTVLNNEILDTITSNMQQIIDAGGLTTAMEDSIVANVQSQVLRIIESQVQNSVANVVPGTSAADIESIVSAVQSSLSGDLIRDQIQSTLNGLDTQIGDVIDTQTNNGNRYQITTFAGQTISKIKTYDPSWVGECRNICNVYRNSTTVSYDSCRSVATGSCFAGVGSD